MVGQDAHVPPPGTLPSTSMERTDRVNWSTLKAIGTSPKHYRHLLANPRADSPAMQLGRVTHCAVFEPAELDNRYIVSPRFNRAMNDDTAILKGYDGGKQAAAAWLASVSGREVIEADTMAAAIAMRDAIMADPVARPYITTGYAEYRIEWTDENTGIECRGRVDHVNGCLADLKTTRSLLSCERDAVRFGYHAQLAWYNDGLAAAGIAAPNPPVLIFVENVPPYDVLVLTFASDDLAIGRRVYRAALDRLAECRILDQWPGVSNGRERRIALPAWAGPIETEITLDGVVI